jgi:hypothetical protein
MAHAREKLVGLCLGLGGVTAVFISTALFSVPQKVVSGRGVVRHSIMGRDTAYGELKLFRCATIALKQLNMVDILLNSSTRCAVSL